MGSDFFEIESRDSFSVTLKRIEDAIITHGMAVFARIDHAEGAKSVGLAMPPTILLLYGSPKGGTPMMLASPRAALDLPLRVLVREEQGRVFVSYHPVVDALVRASVPADLAAKLEPAQRLLADALNR